MNPIALPLPEQIVALVASQAARAAMLDLAARLATAGPLRVLDGGNHFNAYIVAREVRRRTARLEETLDNIRLARAFTCYQMLALLAGCPRDSGPVLVLDLLSTFYDDSVPLAECRRLLAEAMRHIQRLARCGPVVVSARPPARACPERVVLVDDLQAALPTAFLQEEALPQPVQQPALFAW